MGTWQQIFTKEGKVFHKPVYEMREAIRLMKKQGCRRVLDLGCGTGRHSVLLAKAGFDVYAADVSSEGLKQTRAWLDQNRLKAKLKQFSCYGRFPFKDGFFDAVISTQVIHHNYVKKVRFCISEIRRVLKKGGFVFVSVAAGKSTGRSRRSKIVAPRTFVPIDGHERGLPHYLYNKALLRNDFSGFRIIDVWKDKTFHYDLFGIKE